MKTYTIQSNSVGHAVVDHTGEQHGIFGSQAEAQTKIEQLRKSEPKSKAVPVFVETRLEPPKKLVTPTKPVTPKKPVMTFTKHKPIGKKR